MTVIEIFYIICFIFEIILCGFIIKDCWEYLDIIDSLGLRILFKIVVFLNLLLILLSTFFIYNIIIS